MRSFASKLVGLFAVLITGAASAQDVEVTKPTITRGQAWSVYSGYTLGQGNTVLAGQLGWPGISATLLHGVTGEFDVGGRFGFNYGLEGMVREVVPGIRLQGVARINLVDQQRLGLALEFAPGPIFYFRRSVTQVGMALPVKLSVGIPVGSAIMINAGMDVPMFVLFGTGSYFGIPLLFGGGVEYFVNQNLAATFNVKMGPTFRTNNRSAEFALEALFGVAYRL
jgi:opacity protein-like surface antigen